jgi:threonine aldolase
MLGGGTRQAGILAAAGLHALDHHVDRLEEDHMRAERLAAALSDIDGISVHPCPMRTNMVFISMGPSRQKGLAAFMRDQGILMTVEDGPIRIVTHLDISDPDISKTVEAFKRYFDIRQAA